jgi:hypothetical protein
VKGSSSSRSSFFAESGDGKACAAVRPLKICTVFDDDASARSAEVLIRHVTSGYPCDKSLFSSEKLDPPGPGVAAARSAADADILVVALCDDRPFPDHLQPWLDMWLGFRDQDSDGLLVVLVAKGGQDVDVDSSLPEYLETVAGMGGLAFFARPRRVVRMDALDCSRWTGTRMHLLGTNPCGHGRGSFFKQVPRRIENWLHGGGRAPDFTESR